MPFTVTEPDNDVVGGAGGAGANPRAPAVLPTVIAPKPFVFDKPEAESPKPETVAASRNTAQRRRMRDRFTAAPARKSGINL